MHDAERTAGGGEQQAQHSGRDEAAAGEEAAPRRGRDAAEAENAERGDGHRRERAEAKAGKNFALADQIRQTLLAKGIVLKDAASGTSWEAA